jgi:hypothetical protein
VQIQLLLFDLVLLDRLLITLKRLALEAATLFINLLKFYALQLPMTLHTQTIQSVCA